ncbi:MAG TPA: hypothetical protein VMA09_07445 [Candidatus Binataceae bacterium]|nr:hypothetical protein [Candidatus Binataceae bacterium]
MAEQKTAAKPFRAERPRRSRWGRRLLFVIILGLVAGFILTRYDMHPSAEGNQPESVFQATLVQSYPTISRATNQIASQAAGGSSMTASQLLTAAANDGFRRLDDASLGKLLWLSSELANRANTQSCAMLWSGGAGEAFVPAIEQLPVDQQRKWGRIYDRAALASINGLPVRRAPNPQDFQAALSRTMMYMPANDLNAIKAMINDPVHQSDAQKCAAVRAIYAGMMRADYADAITVERGLLHQ